MIDNAMSPDVARACSANGADSVHLRDVAATNSSDETVLSVAMQLKRIVVSRDTDFGTLLAASRATGPSIILIRCPGLNRPAQQARVICDVLVSHARELTQGAIVVFDGKRIRVRMLPVIGGATPSDA